MGLVAFFNNCGSMEPSLSVFGPCARITAILLREGFLRNKLLPKFPLVEIVAKAPSIFFLDGGNYHERATAIQYDYVANLHTKSPSDNTQSQKYTRFARNSRGVLKCRRWPALRQRALRRDGFRCVICGATGRLEVDHIAPVRTHPEKAFDLDNLQSLCARCHTRKTRIECGHPPPNPERLKWQASIRQLTKKESNDA